MPIPCTATPVTPAPPSPRGILSPRQHAAIPLILLGRSDDHVAHAVGVRREAVNRWRNRHPLFIAELNRQRHALHARTVDRYHALLNQSMAIVERWQSARDLDLEDKVKTATAVLRTASRRTFSAAPPPPPAAPGNPLSSPSPTNPDDVLAQLLADGLDPSPDDSPADDAPPPPPEPPKKPRRPRNP